MDTPDDPRPPMLADGDPLDVGGIPATTDVLREVLTRHRHRQSRLLGVVAVVVLVAGAAAGFAIGNGRSTGGTAVAAGQTATTPTTTAPNSSMAFTTGGGPPSMASTQLLLRDAVDGSRVRLYSEDLSAKTACPPNQDCPKPDPACFPSTILTAEVSDNQVAGATGGAVWQPATATGLNLISASVVGQGQPEPILVVLGHGGTDVAKVQVTTPYGSDVQAVTGGRWVALAVRLPADYKPDASNNSRPDLPAGTVTALAASGATLSSTSISHADSKNTGGPCQPTCTETTSAASSGGTPGPETTSGGPASSSTAPSGGTTGGPAKVTTCSCQPVSGPATIAPPGPGHASGQVTAPAPPNNAVKCGSVPGTSSSSAGASGSGVSAVPTTIAK